MKAVLLSLLLTGCQAYSADTLICMGFCAYREHDTIQLQKEELKRHSLQWRKAKPQLDNDSQAEEVRPQKE